jgi:DNA polymerase-4
MERRIICFNVPSFEIALARVNEPSLRRWPAAVAPLHYTRSFLWEVSAEARQEGIYEGMALSDARRLCPRLRIIAPDARRISLGQKLLRETIQYFSPIYELANRGQLYADVSGSTRLFGDPASIAGRIHSEISQRHGISGAAGVAHSKLVSGVIANLLDPASIYRVRPGDEESFLRPLPVTCLPELRRLFGANCDDIIAMLEELCLRSLGHIAAVPAGQLELVVGGKARLLKQWAKGIDPSPIWPESQTPLLGLSHTFDGDEIDDSSLLTVSYRLLERICNDLRRQNRSVTRVALTLGYADGLQICKTRKCWPPSCFESEIYPVVEDLFFSINRRVRVRRILLNVDAMPAATTQLDLFHQETFSGLKKLTAAIDSIRERYGDESIGRGKVANLD